MQPCFENSIHNCSVAHRKCHDNNCCECDIKPASIVPYIACGDTNPDTNTVRKTDKQTLRQILVYEILGLRRYRSQIARHTSGVPYPGYAAVIKNNSTFGKSNAGGTIRLPGNGNRREIYFEWSVT